jgi:hypothetical protein
VSRTPVVVTKAADVKALVDAAANALKLIETNERRAAKSRASRWRRR